MKKSKEQDHLSEKEALDASLKKIQNPTTLKILKGLIAKDHYLLLNWQIFKYPIREHLGQATFHFTSPFATMGTVTLKTLDGKIQCFIDNGDKKIKSHFLSDLEDVINFIYLSVEGPAVKKCA